MVADGLLDQLVTHARECLPEEACGFLVGHQDTALRFVPAVNVLASPTAYSVQPQFLFDLFRELRRTGEDMVAVFHSHPSGPAVPSRRDIAETYYPDTAHVIVSFTAERPEIRVFRVVEEEALEIELHAIVRGIVDGPMEVQMRHLLIVLLMGVCLIPAATAEQQRTGEEMPFDIRARANLFFGTGVTTNHLYFDVPITQLPEEGVLIKLPYTQKGGQLTFDVHHRVGLSPDFGLPAEIMTVIEIMTGGTNKLGTYTLLDDIGPDAAAEEEISRASDAEIDRHISPLVTKSISINTLPGPQSISIVGQNLNITRLGRTTLIDTPGTRIAMVSNIKFTEIREGTPLEFGDQD